LDFDFPEELILLKETAASFLDEKCPTALARRVIDEGGDFERDLWREMAAMGWLSATIPERFGGMGLGHLASCVLAEALGRAIAPVPFVTSACLATEALLQFGDEAQREKYLPPLAAGQSIGTFAFAETTGPVVPSRFKTRGGGGHVSGEKRAVVDGSVADFAIVATRSEANEPSLHIVDLAQPRVSRLTQPSIDPSRSHMSLSFDGAEASPLPGALGSLAIEALLNRAAVVVAFEQLGVAQSALDMACAFAKERYAFGRPIGSFQAIKHKLVDVYVALELARSNCYYGAVALENDAQDLPIAAATCRISACDAGWLATKENIQTHGGMGFTWELDCHLYYRRAKLLGLMLGSAREWKLKLMQRIRQQGTVELLDDTQRGGSR
jgi:acyl-CoA dehydrogenase